MYVYTLGNSDVYHYIIMKAQARSQDFCVGGRLEQKVDLFIFFFLSVKRGGGGAGACSRDFVLNPCAAKSKYIRFK